MLIPVIDICDGFAVHAIGGDRKEYQPVERFGVSGCPLKLAGLFVENYQPRQIYIADLDSLQRKSEPTALEIANEIAKQYGITVCVDSHWPSLLKKDISNPFDTSAISDSLCPILSIESHSNLSSLESSFNALQDRKLKPFVSIDLNNGKLFSSSNDWPSIDELIEQSIEIGFRCFIILELSCVGTAKELTHLETLKQQTYKHPEFEWLIGGGIRNNNHLESAIDAGASGVLVASGLLSQELSPVNPKLAIRSLIAKICELGGDSKNFVRSHHEIEPILNSLGAKIPKDLQEYIAHYIPEKSYGRQVTFHSLTGLIEEHTQAIPACEVLNFGFFCFAQEGDGSQFAYCVHDQRIYHLGFNIEYESTDEVIEKAWHSWPSLQSFLIRYANILKSFHSKKRAAKNSGPNLLN